jgi:hypothetical protein
MPKLKEFVYCIQDPISENLLLTGGKVRPLYRLLILFFWHNASDKLVAFAQFDRFARAQPCFEPSSIPELSNIDRWHEVIVPQLCVTSQWEKNGYYRLLNRQHAAKVQNCSDSPV